MTQAYAWQENPESLVQRYLYDPRPELKELILAEYTSLVERVARRFTGLEQHDDLVQVGFLGLLNALSKFDPEAGVRFNTYATYLVAGEIKHFLRDRAQTIRQPAWLQELRHKVNRTQNILLQNLGRTPTEAEIAAELGVSEASIREVVQTQEMLRLASLDASPSEDDTENDVDRLDAAEFCPEQLGFEDRMVLEHAMRQLRDLERQVMTHYHFDSMNQTEIANRLGISCNYVSHILRQSLNKLRRILASEERKDQMIRRQEKSIDYDVIDSETGAYTEAYFKNRLEEEVHRASGQSGAVALAVVRFQGLEQLRTFYGEESVMDFLAETADFLRDTVRRLDVVCRFGKTGFAVILPATGQHATVVQERLSSKLQAWIADRFTMANTVRVCIGQACFPDQAKWAADLLEAAVSSSSLSLEGDQQAA